MIEFLVAGLFTDHMVLQQQRSNPVWGWDQPGQAITLTVEGVQSGPLQVSVTTAQDGSWRLLCPELPAGGPYRLTVKGSGVQVLDDVLVGEVWLASGQSNMAWVLSNTDGGAEDVQAAQFPAIRSIRVSNQAARSPQRIIGGSWSVCSPATAGGYSAVAYHYANKLHKAFKVPVGIIDSSWGGTRVEAWTSEQALARVMDLNSELASLEPQWNKLPALKAEFGKKVTDWEARMFPADPGNTGEGLGWAAPGFDDSAWRMLSLPGLWQQQGIPETGVVWLRRTIEIPEAWAGCELQLELGQVKDFDETYFNGVKVGSHPKGTPRAAAIRRSYTVPASLVKAGRAVVAVRAFDQNGGGGLLGPGPVMGLRCNEKPDTPRVRLAGAWRARLEASVTVGTIDWATNPWPDFPEEQYWPASIHNGMIAPLAGYGIRGAIWYQGETNADAHPETYAARFQALIRDWRESWGQGDFPFYFIQLPNFHSNDGWPVIREGQAAALALPATGMVTAIDLGNPDDIHPREKRRVSARLANLALADCYGLPGIVAQGPVRRSAEFTGGKARIQFLNAQGLRTRDGAAAVLGFELAGSDGVFHPATARIEGETVLVESPAVPEPRSVRYAWKACPETNLVNGADLPARPFGS